jgi:hypothetical protein
VTAAHQGQRLLDLLLLGAEIALQRGGVAARDQVEVSCRDAARALDPALPRRLPQLR